MPTTRGSFSSPHNIECFLAVTWEETSFFIVCKEVCGDVGQYRPLSIQMLGSVVGELENVRPFHLVCGHRNAVNIQTNVLSELGVLAFSLN